MHALLLMMVVTCSASRAGKPYDVLMISVDDLRTE
jgi:hypothetical protein